MILYGRRGENAVTGQVPGLCGNCEKNVEFSYAISNNYFHLFFIPTFPIGKSVGLVCPVCKTVSRDSEINAPFRNELKAQNKEKIKVPFYHFAGLGLIVFFVFYCIYNSKAEAKLTREYLNSPKAGDLYELKLKERSYTVYRLKTANKDTLRFIPNRYETTSAAGLIDLEYKDSTFDQSNFNLPDMVILREKAKEMLNNGELLQIKRGQL